MSQDGAYPSLCTANQCDYRQRLVYLKQMLNHSLLTQDERYICLWLAIQCAQDIHFSCTYSYEHISNAVNRSCQVVHRALSRLRVMGFLRTSLPIWYKTLLPQMVSEVRTYQLIIPSQLFLEYQQGIRVIEKKEAEKGH